MQQAAIGTLQFFEAAGNGHELSDHIDTHKRVRANHRRSSIDFDRRNKAGRCISTARTLRDGPHV